MDTCFAQIVQDMNGRNHILIEGRMVSLYGPTGEVNEMVEAIVRGLRRAGGKDMCGQMSPPIEEEEEAVAIITPMTPAEEHAFIQKVAQRHNDRKLS